MTTPKNTWYMIEMDRECGVHRVRVISRRDGEQDKYVDIEARVGAVDLPATTVPESAFTGETSVQRERKVWIGETPPGPPGPPVGRDFILASYKNLVPDVNFAMK